MPLVAGIFSMCNGVVNSLQLLERAGIFPGIPLFFSVNAIILFVPVAFMGKVVDKSGLPGVINFSFIAGAGFHGAAGAALSGMPLIIYCRRCLKRSPTRGGGPYPLETACIKKLGPVRVGNATSTYYIRDRHRSGNRTYSLQVKLRENT